MWYTLAIVCGIGINFQLFYNVTLTEIICPLVGYFLFWLYFIIPKCHPFSPRVREQAGRVTSNLSILLLLFLLYILSQFISDFLHNSGLLVIKASMRLISIGIVTLVFIYAERRQKNFILYLLVAFLISGIILDLLDPGYPEWSRTLWRDKLGEKLTLLGIILSSGFSPLYSFLFINMLAVLNITLDFRGLALICLMSGGVILIKRYFFHLPLLWRYVLIITPVFSIFLFSIIYVQTRSTYGDRRDISNLIRYEMTLEGVRDFFQPKFFGNGSYSFHKKFHIPKELTNKKVRQRIEEHVNIHGYMWDASYNAGKLGFLFYLALLFCNIRFIIQYMSPSSSKKYNNIIPFLVIYVSYCSLMHTFANLDKFLLALNLTILGTEGFKHLHETHHA